MKAEGKEPIRENEYWKRIQIKGSLQAGYRGVAR
jgi:hypothetical protein